MKNIILKILYKSWVYLVTNDKYPKLCEKINLWINKLES